MIFEEESSTDYKWERKKSFVNRHNPIDESNKNRGKGSSAEQVVQNAERKVQMRLRA